MFIIEKTCNRISNLLCSKISHRQVCCKYFCDYHYICRHRVAIGKYDQIKDCVKLDKWLSFVLKELASFCSVFIKSSRFFPVGFFAINLRPLWPFFFFFFFFFFWFFTSFHQSPAVISFTCNSICKLLLFDINSEKVRIIWW